jgi:hypothetical protein
MAVYKVQWVTQAGLFVRHLVSVMTPKLVLPSFSMRNAFMPKSERRKRRNRAGLSRPTCQNHVFQSGSAYVFGLIDTEIGADLRA